MAYPIGISPWSDGKPPQAVRQASHEFDVSRRAIRVVARDGDR